MTDNKQANVSYERKDGTKVFRKSIRIDGRIISQTFSRKTDADRWYVEQKREKELIETGLKTEFKEVGFEEFARKWLADRRATGKPLSSWQSDEQRLRLHIFPKMGGRTLHRIPTKDWEEFLDSLVKTEAVGPSTRNKARTLLHKLYNDARRQGFVEINPITAIPRLVEADNKWDYFHTTEEVQAYLDQARVVGGGFDLFAMMALNTGLRMGEILALCHADVDLARNRIRVWRTFEQCSNTVQERLKGGQHQRWIGINPALHQVLLEHKVAARDRRPDDTLVKREDGTQASEDWIRRRHWWACKRAKLRDIRVHDLRHTFASHYMMNGGNLMDLKMILDHSDITVTQRYAHFAPGYLDSKSSVVSFSGRSSCAQVLSLQEHRREVSMK